MRKSDLCIPYLIILLLIVCPAAAHRLNGSPAVTINPTTYFSPASSVGAAALQAPRLNYPGDSENGDSENSLTSQSSQLRAAASLQKLEESSEEGKKEALEAHEKHMEELEEKGRMKGREQEEEDQALKARQSMAASMRESDRVLRRNIKGYAQEEAKQAHKDKEEEAALELQDLRTEAQGKAKYFTQAALSKRSLLHDENRRVAQDVLLADREISNSLREVTPVGADGHHKDRKSHGFSSPIRKRPATDMKEKLKDSSGEDNAYQMEPCACLHASSEDCKSDTDKHNKELKDEDNNYQEAKKGKNERDEKETEETQSGSDKMGSDEREDSDNDELDENETGGSKEDIKGKEESQDSASLGNTSLKDEYNHNEEYLPNDTKKTNANEAGQQGRKDESKAKIEDQDDEDEDEEEAEDEETEEE